MERKQYPERLLKRIIALWLGGMSQTKIADKLGVGYALVNRTVREYTRDGLHKPEQKK